MPRPNPTEQEIQAEMTKYPSGPINRDVAIGNILMRPEPATSPLPALDTSSAVISPGLENQSNINIAKNQTQKLDDLFAEEDQALKDLADRGGYADTAEGKVDFSNVQIKANEMKTLNATDLADIEQAGTLEGAKYETLIAQAKAKRVSGMASGLTAAAKAGGLDTSAWVGISALVGEPAGGPAGFEGIGGKLAQMGSDYDAVVADLQSKQIQAIALAKQAKREAVLTGKKEDWNTAVKMYDMAKSIYDDKTTMLTNKLSVLNSYSKFLQDSAEGQVAKMDKFLSVGMDVPDEVKSGIDSLYGAGFADKYIETSRNAKNAIDMETQLKTISDIYSLLSKIPEGQSIKIGDATYKGIKTMDVNTQTFSETDSAGNVTYITMDKTTGKIINAVSGGRIGKGKEGDNQPTEEDFRKDISDMIEKLDNPDPAKKISWGTAFDMIKTKYPQVDDATINAMLGGSVDYNPETGEFTNPKGRAAK